MSENVSITPIIVSRASLNGTIIDIWGAIQGRADMPQAPQLADDVPITLDGVPFDDGYPERLVSWIVSRVTAGTPPLLTLYSDREEGIERAEFRSMP